MQHQEKYTLQWHSYSDHLREALNEMLLSSEFADVTLVTDDKQQIRAHRNILSACSPVFKSILQIDSNNSNPVIYLRGMQHSEIESIMQFIYLGETRFYEERMSEFLTVSKNLEIKELSTSIEMNDKTTSDQLETNESNIADENMEITGVHPQATHEDDGNVDPQAKTEPITVNKAANIRVGRTEVVSGEGKFQCPQCDKLFSHNKSVHNHIRSAHEGMKYACNKCDQQFTTQRSMVRHIKSMHERGTQV